MATNGRQSFTLLLAFGAMIFGMVLAGGLDLTPVGFAQSGGEPVRLAASNGPAALPTFADLAEAVSPAVVSIQAIKIERAGASRRGQDPFEFFFGPRGRQQRPDAPQGEGRRDDSSGSGFVISADGLIVTNHHVIEDADSLVVLLNGREYPATVKGDDPATDIALLKIEPEEPLTFLDMADSDNVRVGDWIMVIGSPLRLENSVSVGVVSAKGRSINITPDASLENFIQTDAAINFGNSGGPLVNLRGQVVGIATAINFGAENIGFAVPANTLQNILPQLRESGVVRRGYLGVNIADLGFEDAEAWDLPTTDGALITLVRKNSPAEEGGLEHGDVIIEVDGRKIADNRSLIDYVSSKPPGATVDVKVIRNGDPVVRPVKLGERPGNDVVAAVEPEQEQGEIDWLGIQYLDLAPQVRQMHNMPSDLDGVWIGAVAPDSPLFDEQVRQGDVIVEVNGEPVDGVRAFEDAVAGVESGKFLRLYVSRVNPRTGEVAASFFAVVRVP